MNKVLILLVILSVGIGTAQAQRLGNRRNQNTSNPSAPANTGKGVDYGAPREYVLSGIRVTGAKFLDEGALVSISGMKLGDKVRVPSDYFSNAIRKLWRRDIVGDVQILIDKIEEDKIYLVLQLAELPKLTRFVFSGIRKGEQQTLTDKIGLIRGKVINKALLKNTQLKIEKYYIEKGFLNAKANIVQQRDSILANSVYLKINVVKGTRVKIQSIDFTGNNDFDDKRLQKRLKNTKEKRAGRIFKASRYVKAKYEEDKENLIKFYNNRGYRDARIIDDEVYKVNNQLIGIKLNLDEGRQYFYRNITWRGNYVYTSEQLGRILGIKKGDVYDLEALEKKLNFSQTEQDITSLYMDDGYLFFRIEPREVAIEGDSVDIEMDIFEGEQANINQIILNGNTKTSDKVVLREIRTVPGQRFSRTDLIRTQREIATIGYFDPEQIGLNPIPNPQDGTVDIDYSVVEKPSDQVELSGGWGGVFGFVGTLGLTFNNFAIRKALRFREWGGILPSGDGQRLSLRFQANGRRFQTYSLTFTEPWLGGRKPNSFSVNFSHSVQRNINFQTNQVIGSLQVTTASVSLGRRLQWPDNFFTISNSLSYTRYNIDNFGNQVFANGKGVSNSVALNLTLQRNSIDNPTFPRSGSSITLSITATPPYSLFRGEQNYAEQPDTEKFRWIEYHKWMLDNTWYARLFGKFVMATRAHFGYIGAYNQQLGVGPFERFALGGDGLTGFNFLLGTEIIGLRGYENNSIAPRNSPGGVIYNKFVMDIRYPISTNPAATIFALAFAEAGNNFGSHAEYNPFNLKRSAGIGARVFMPAFGMLGLDWGYGFDTVPGSTSRGGRFHFTIGQQIR